MKPRIASLAAPLACSGCAGWQSALDPGGLQALRLDHLIWWTVGVCTAIWIAVIVVLALAMLRRGAGASPEAAGATRTDRRLTICVSAAVAATVAIIVGLTTASLVTTRRLAAAGQQEPVVIRVRGLQWWWEAIYPGERPGDQVSTANEIHVPVGRPVRVELAAADVIHSFWVPSLAGKLDLIPGRDNVLTFTALRPGVYRGQCAEFCGLQHAHMAFLVVAEAASDFETWRRAQAASAAEPADGEERHGRDVFVAKACSGCHSVRGTSASGTTGPDLTHVGGRRTIAAGLLETTRGSLAAWIADPQTLKPGSNMPMVPLSADELKAVSAYMASLK